MTAEEVKYLLGYMKQYYPQKFRNYTYEDGMRMIHNYHRVLEPYKLSTALSVVDSVRKHGFRLSSIFEVDELERRCKSREEYAEWEEEQRDKTHDGWTNDEIIADAMRIQMGEKTGIKPSTAEIEEISERYREWRKCYVKRTSKRSI